ncbi:MAG: NUDIX hydrolase [Alphaproteobacteria bacterium]
MTSRPPKISVIVMIDGKIPLLQREAKGEEWWDLPGGKPEGAETYEETAAREIAEELGIEVAGCEELDEMPHPFPGSSDNIIFFACRHVSGEPDNKLPAEHKALQMMRGEDAIAKLGARINENIASYIRNNT